MSAEITETALHAYHAAHDAYSRRAAYHRAPWHNCLADDARPFDPLPEWGELIDAGRRAIAAGVDPCELSAGVLLALGKTPTCDIAGRVVNVA